MKDIIGLRSDEVVGTYNGTWEGAYERGYRKPRYAVPAVVVGVAVTVVGENSPYSNSVTFWHVGATCPCCGKPEVSLQAIVDFDYDRSKDFFLPHGVYCSASELEAGLTAYELFVETDSDVQ